MSRFLGALFAAIVLGSVIGLDYVVTRQKADAAEYGLVEHLTARVMQFRAGVSVIAGDPLPPAPAGWTARPATNADTFAAMGVRPTEAMSAQMDQMEKTLYGALGPHERLRRTYVKDDQVVTLDILVLSEEAAKEPGTAAFGQIYSNFARRSASGPLLTNDGVDLYQVDDPALGRAAFVHGRIGEQIFIGAMTNAGKAGSIEVLEGIDMLALAGRTLRSGGSLSADQAEASDAVASTPTEKAPKAEPESKFKRVGTLTGGSCGAGNFCSAGN